MNSRGRHPSVMRAWLLAGLAGLAPAAMASGVPAPAIAASVPAATVPAAAASIVAIMAGPGLTLEQAVTAVQQKTSGKVLRASSRQYGDATEYRVKVLTPDGHVLVIPVRSQPAAQPTRHKPKETH